MNEELLKRIDAILAKEKMYMPIYNLFPEQDGKMPNSIYYFPLKTAIKKISIIDDRMTRYQAFMYTIEVKIPKEFTFMPAGWHTKKINLSLSDIELYTRKTPIEVFGDWVYNALAFKREDPQVRRLLKKVLRGIYWKDANFTWNWDTCTWNELRLGLLDTWGVDLRNTYRAQCASLRDVVNAQMVQAQLIQQAVIQQAAQPVHHQVQINNGGFAPIPWNFNPGLIPPIIGGFLEEDLAMPPEHDP